MDFLTHVDNKKWKFNVILAAARGGESHDRSCMNRPLSHRVRTKRHKPPWVIGAYAKRVR